MKNMDNYRREEDLLQRSEKAYKKKRNGTG
jgi:hypothetical protein